MSDNVLAFRLGHGIGKRGTGGGQECEPWQRLRKCKHPMRAAIHRPARTLNPKAIPGSPSATRARSRDSTVRNRYDWREVVVYMKQFGTLIVILAVSVGVGISANSAISSQILALEQQEKLDLQSLNQQMADLKQKHQSETAP